MLRYRYYLILIGLLGWLIGCQSAAPSDSNADADATGSLVIYSGRSESLVGPIIEVFRQTTGIDVNVRYGSTGEMAALLLEEGEASPADVFYAQDPGGLGAVQAAGLLATLPEEVLSQVHPRFISDEEQWVGVSGRARVVVYNTETIPNPAEMLPADIFDFTQPEWQGRLGWAPTNGSFQAMVTAMRTQWGDEKTAEWLQGIQANEPVVYEGNTQAVAGVGAGEVDVAFVNHYYLYRFLAEQGESFPARNYFLPGGGPGSLLMVSGAGVLANATNVDNALRFINFLLSPAAQQYFASETYEYPVVEGIITDPQLTPLEEVEAQATEIDISDYADLEGTVQLLTQVGILP